MARRRTGFHLCLGSPDRRQTILSALQFARNVNFASRLGIGRFGHRHQLLDLGLQLRLKPVGILPTQRLVPGGVGLNLGTVKADRTQPQKAHRPGHHQDLDKQIPQLADKTLAERRDRVVIGMAVRRNVAERHRIPSRLLQLAAREYARGIAVEQKGQKHPGMIRTLAAMAVRRCQSAKIKTVDNLDHKPRQVILGKPILHRGRKQPRRLSIHLTEISRYHASPCPKEATPMTHTIKRSRHTGQETTHIRLNGSITGSACRIASNPTLWSFCRASSTVRPGTSRGSMPGHPEQFVDVVKATLSIRSRFRLHSR